MLTLESNNGACATHIYRVVRRLRSLTDDIKASPSRYVSFAIDVIGTGRLGVVDIQILHFTSGIFDLVNFGVKVHDSKRFSRYYKL